MKYTRADLVLPNELLKELQKYVQDGLIYIPKPKALHKKWGETSGSRKLVEDRNAEIKQKFQDGYCMEQLSNEYFLSTETIRKIVYKH